MCVCVCHIVYIFLHDTSWYKKNWHINTCRMGCFTPVASVRLLPQSTIQAMSTVADKSTCEIHLKWLHGIHGICIANVCSELPSVSMPELPLTNGRHWAQRLRLRVKNHQSFFPQRSNMSNSIASAHICTAIADLNIGTVFVVPCPQAHDFPWLVYQ